MSETAPRARQSAYSRVRTDELIQIHRSRWELAQRVAELEAEARRQSAVARQMAERAADAEYRQRELLKAIASAVDDCEDALRIAAARQAGLVDAAGRQDGRWQRRFARLRGSLAACLQRSGVSYRVPSGLPAADFDAVHSALPTGAVPVGEIVEVLRPGIVWNNRPLRLALVVVAAAPEGQ
ncbi:MAG TPA: nucleotide exchange factor GrpE [Chthonomonadaceae bacterium]|nr:nucleotide exchange factor GrpE [Chthonomonadaceae bacterium]